MIESNWDDFSVVCLSSGPSQLLETYQEYVNDYHENSRWDSLVGAVILWHELNEIISDLDGFDKIFFRAELDYELPTQWGWYVSMVNNWLVRMEPHQIPDGFDVWVETFEGVQLESMP